MNKCLSIVGSINEMSSREAMGLPLSFKATEFDDISSEFKSLVNCPPVVLANTVEDSSLDLKIRYVAGIILSFVGDPRISTFKPKMIDIPEKKLRLD